MSLKKVGIKRVLRKNNQDFLPAEILEMVTDWFSVANKGTIEKFVISFGDGGFADIDAKELMIDSVVYFKED